jgi:CheY-like chemotaxis protein
MSPEPTQSCRVLIVEDHHDCLTTMVELLTLCGYEVCGVRDSRAALASVGSFMPDVILLDLGLPIVDGYSVAEAIRADPAHDDVQIVAVSGHGSVLDKRRSAAAGIDLHLVKPVLLDELLRAIRCGPPKLVPTLMLDRA